MGDYEEFIASKAQLDGDHGFDPVWMPDMLFGFQATLVAWALRKGRAAIFADCGLGKTLMQLVWAENVVRKTGGRVLVITPLAVSHQTIAEGEQFGIEAHRVTRPGDVHPGINVVNYERLGWINASDFHGAVCDESSALKNFDGVTKAAVTEFMRTLPYRLLCTATAAPNDYIELGTSSEALGYLGYQDMLSRFFKEDTIKDGFLGWGRKGYRFRGHAEVPFWRWVCSWARACRKPSDLGFDDDGYDLPALRQHEIVVEASRPRKGMLFDMPARDLSEQRQERRHTIPDRCEAAAKVAAEATGPSVVWCHLNDEADLLESLIPGAVQVSGSLPEEEKERRLLAFQRGDIRTLVTKPKIGCFGLNWQHCSDVVTFPSHSWEQYYQAVRRCWRFGQKSPVDVTIVTSKGEEGVLANLKRKADAADRMFEALVRHMNGAMAVDHRRKFDKTEEVPQWLVTTK